MSDVSSYSYRSQVTVSPGFLFQEASAPYGATVAFSRVGHLANQWGLTFLVCGQPRWDLSRFRAANQRGLSLLIGRDTGDLADP